MRNKFEFILFDNKIHKLLQKEGISNIGCRGYILENEIYEGKVKYIDGYSLEALSFHTDADESDSLISNQILISVGWVIIKNQPEILKIYLKGGPKKNQEISEILKKYDAEADCDHSIRGGFVPISGKEEITDSGILYPISADRLRLMYPENSNCKFYLVIDKSNDYSLALLSKIKPKMIFRKYFEKK